MPFCRILKTVPLLYWRDHRKPSFELNSALLSRARVYLLKSLTTDDIERVLDRAMNDKTRGYGGQDIILPDETRRAIAELVNDARRALNTPK